VIGIDTNILIRYLTQDDPVQSAKATELMERRLTERNRGFVTVVTVAETVCVLDSVYGLTNVELANTVERILQAEALLVQNEQEVFAAAATLKSGIGTFSDALIGELGRWAGCRVTLTFDRRAVRLKAFALCD